MSDLVVCSWPIEKVIPYARNSRKIPGRAVDKVAASIKEFGFRQPIVVDKDGVVVCGQKPAFWLRRSSAFATFPSTSPRT